MAAHAPETPTPLAQERVAPFPREVAQAPLSSRARTWRGLIVLAPAAAGVVYLLAGEPIPQDLGYHDFADKRTLLGIPFFGDVVTNLALFLAGLRGLLFMARSEAVSQGRPFAEHGERLAYTLFFAMILLAGIGSTWYHLAPDNQRIFWDRLPLAVAFLAFFDIVITERISPRLGAMLLWPLAVLAAASVFHWQASEAAGRGDLRLYGLVQYYPMAAVPLILLLFPPRYTRASVFWWVLAWYGGAKLAELLDRPIYDLTGAISGHNLKHILAAAAVLSLVPMLKRRNPVA